MSFMTDTLMRTRQQAAQMEASRQPPQTTQPMPRRNMFSAQRPKPVSTQTTQPVRGATRATMADLNRSGRVGYRGGRRMGAQPVRAPMFANRVGRGGAVPYAGAEDQARRSAEMRDMRRSYFADRMKGRNFGGGGGGFGPPVQHTQPYGVVPWSTY